MVASVPTKPKRYADFLANVCFYTYKSNQSNAQNQQRGRNEREKLLEGRANKHACMRALQ